MNEDFIKAYEAELRILYERSSAFAQSHPDVAGNLGMLTRDHYDPGIKGLLEGSAFLAARVQVKLADEFNGFTEALLEQVMPDALTPVPSMALLDVQPRHDEKDARKGMTLAAGEMLSIRSTVQDKPIECRYRLADSVTVYPIKLDTVAYFARPTPISALGLDVTQDTRAGMVLELSCSFPTKSADTFAGITMDRLRVHLLGNPQTTATLYEQIHARCCGLGLIHETPAGDSSYLRLDRHAIEPIGFGPDEGLLPHNGRVLRGFTFLREYFAFPQKFLGFQIRGLKNVLPQVKGGKLKLVLEFTEATKRLESEVTAANMCLHGCPAINLFTEDGLSVSLGGREHDVPLPDAPDREIYRIKTVRVHRGRQIIDDCLPLYRIPSRPDLVRPRARFTTRRRRRIAEDEQRRELRIAYAGCDTLLTLYDPPEIADDAPAMTLRVDCECTNRHLPVLLSGPAAGASFKLVSDQTVTLKTVFGPTLPRESFTERRRQRDRDAGPALWRLISYLQLGQFGLDAGHPEDRAAGLREMLTLFADVGGSSAETSLMALTDLRTRPVTRSILRDGISFPARGTEVTVTFDETAAPALGIFLLGSVLDRFLAEYASINSFTQTRIVSESRGTIHRFPPRSGEGPLL